MRPVFSLYFRTWLILACILCGFRSLPAQDAGGFKFLEVKVVDPDGKPMADVPVEININNMKFPMPTDEKGIVAVNVPAGEEGELELSVQHPGYMAQGARWSKGRKTPDQFTIPMKKGTAIGGLVHDDEGQPIEGVTIKGIITSFDRNDLNSGNGELRPVLDGEIAVTDADGRWQTDMAPEEEVELQLMFSHPDYVSDRGYSFRGGTWEELKAEKNIVVMDSGITIAGRVVDGEGNPIAGAQVAIGARYESRRFVTKTDEQGNFEVPKAGEGSTSLTVTAAGFAPETKGLSVSKGMEPVRVGLTPGNTVRMRVIDKDGAPIVGVRIEPNEWRGTQNLEDTKRLTDNEGRWEWGDAPADEIKYNIGKQGYFSVNETFTPGDEERIITLPPEVVVNGNVIDKETRAAPIELFRHVEGAWWEPSYDTYVLQSHRVQAGKRGKFRFPMSSACVKFCIRVDADGYRPTVSREIFPNEGEISLDFEMEKGMGPSGVVVSSDGMPVEGAEVALATAQQEVYLDEGKIQDNAALARVTTDAKGQFTLPFADGKFAVVVTHDTGWAEHDGADLDEPLKLTLSPWSTISGESLRGTEPVADETILFNIQRPYDPQSPRVHWSYQTETSTAGAFGFRRVRSGPITVQRYIPYAKTGANGWLSVYSHGMRIDPKPGEVIHVQIGGEGRHLKGKLAVAEGGASTIDWNMACVQLTRKKSESANTGVPKDYGGTIAQDGTLEIFDVAPGSYDVHVMVYPKDAATTGWNQLADLKTICEVAEGPGDEIIDLGTFTVPLVKPQN